MTDDWRDCPDCAAWSQRHGPFRCDECGLWVTRAPHQQHGEGVGDEAGAREVQRHELGMVERHRAHRVEERFGGREPR